MNCNTYKNLLAEQTKVFITIMFSLHVVLTTAKCFILAEFLKALMTNFGAFRTRIQGKKESPEALEKGFPIFLHSELILLYRLSNQHAKQLLEENKTNSLF
jgi:hypothetical protein